MTMKNVLCFLAVFMIAQGVCQAEMKMIHPYKTTIELRNSTTNELYHRETRLICPICQREGKRSKIHIGGSFCTLAHCGSGYYDENGDYHAPKRCNSCSTSYTCSNGHAFSASEESW